MSGYKNSEQGIFTNATTTNSQIVKQREKISQANNNRRAPSDLGISRVSSRLFTYDDGLIGQVGLDAIFASSFETFNRLDEKAFASDSSFNPDFLSNVNLDSVNRDLYSDITNAEDLPNEKGPNLAAPDINQLQEGSIVPGSSAPLGSEHFKERGFGWRDDRNEPGTDEARIGTYFKRHYKAADDLSKENPLFGEAKSPEDDIFIQYDQPS